MQVFINEQEVGSVSPAGLLVGEVLDALEAHVDPDQMIFEVDLDGESFSAADDSFARRSAASISRLALRTVACCEVGFGIWRDVVEALSAASGKVKRATDWFLAGDAGRAQPLLRELLDELDLTLVLDAQTAARAGRPRLTAPPDLQSVCERLLKAQAGGANDEVRRLLEVELGPLLGRWRRRALSPS